MSKQELVDSAARESLRLLGADPENWVLPTPGVDHDVAIIGGAQSGITTAFALRRAGISNITVIDAADKAHAGGWLSPARMKTLRTPKTRSGPELGNAALGFQAWYEGLHGREAFEAIGRIARTDWADYLEWFHQQIDVPVRYETRLVDVRPTADGHLELHLIADGRELVEVTRKVVFATGVQGCGGPYIPGIFENLPQQLWAHTQQEIDFEALRDKSVGVVGAATSALDAAATALEGGAAEAHLFSRRPEIPVQGAAPRNAGAQDNFQFRPDAARWKAALGRLRSGTPSPIDSVLRPAAFSNFYIHLNAPVHAAHEEDGRVVIEAADGTHIFDYLILGTGYQHDPSTRPELKGIAEHIALWRDVYQPPAGEDSESLGLTPYLGLGYELTAKRPQETPWVSDIYMFNATGMMSFGRPVGDIPSLRTGIPRLVNAIARDLVLEDLTRHEEAAAAGNGELPTESAIERYAHAIWKPSESDDVAALTAGGVNA